MAGKSISNDLRSKDQFKTEVVKWAEKITVNPGQIRIQKMKKNGRPVPQTDGSVSVWIF